MSSSQRATLCRMTGERPGSWKTSVFPSPSPATLISYYYSSAFLAFLSFSILTRGILVLVYVQMVFLIDLPRLEDPAASPPQTPTGFYTELVYFLQATGVGEKMVASLSNYDFSKTSDIAFVHTMCVLSRDVPERDRGRETRQIAPPFDRRCITDRNQTSSFRPGSHTGRAAERTGWSRQNPRCYESSGNLGTCHR